MMKKSNSMTSTSASAEGPMSIPFQCKFYCHHPDDTTFKKMPKMKAIDIHPTKSWVVTADEKLRICVWDYRSRCIQQTIYPIDLLQHHHNTNKANASGQQQQFIHKRQGSRSDSSDSVFNELSTASAIPSIANTNKGGGGGGEEHIKSIKLNEIKSVKWYDDVTIESLTCAVTCERSITMLLILTDSNIILYDYVSQCIIGEIRPDDMNVSTRPSFTTINCVSENLIAIGCSDGIIRIWDTGTQHVVRELNSHSKSITYLLTVHPTSLFQKAEDSRLRLLSVDASGTILLWDIAYAGNMVDGDSPVCMLNNDVSNNVLDVSFDATTGICVVLFDKQPCASIFNIAEVFISESKPQFRSNWADTTPKGKERKASRAIPSFLTTTSSPTRKNTVNRSKSTAGGGPSIPIVYPVYRLTATPPKDTWHTFTQIIPSGHPRLGSMGVIGCTKASMLWVLQWNKATINWVPNPTDALSAGESSPQTTSTSPTSSIGKSAINPDADQDAYNQQLFDLKSSRAALPNKLKIYAFRRHPLLPSSLFAATNIGIFVLEMDSFRTTPCFYRSLWPSPSNTPELIEYLKKISPGLDKKEYIRFLECTNYSLPSASAMAKTKTESASQFRHLALLIEQGSLVMRQFYVTNASKDKNNKDFNVFIELGPFCKLYDVCSPPGSHNVSRGSVGPPEISVSNSGNFIALFWPDLKCYVVLKLIREKIHTTTSLISEENSLTFTTSEIEKGTAQSLAWASQSTLTVDYLSLCTPSIKLGGTTYNEAKERRSSKDSSMMMASNAEVPSIPGSFVLKSFGVDGIKTQELFTPIPINKIFGGLLLGASYVAKAEEKKTLGGKTLPSLPPPPPSVDPKNRKATAKVTSGKESVVNAPKETTETKEDEKVKFYNWSKVISVDTNLYERDAKDIKKEDIAAAATGEFKRSTLEKIGVSIPAPRLISWDPFEQFVAFIYDDNVHLFSLRPSLHSIATISLSVTSVLWYNLTLFVATHSEVRAIFPYATGIHSILLASISEKGLVLPLSLPSDCMTPPLQHLQAGCVTLLSVCGGALIVSGFEGSLSVIQLHYPCLRVYFLLCCREPSRALKWANETIHQSIHDNVASVFGSFGFFSEAINLVGLTNEKRLEMALKFNLIPTLTDLASNYARLKSIDENLKLKCNHIEDENNTILTSCKRLSMKLAQLKLYKELLTLCESAFEAKDYDNAIFAAYLIPEKNVLLNLLQYDGRLPEAITLAASLDKKDLVVSLSKKWNELLLLESTRKSSFFKDVQIKGNIV